MPASLRSLLAGLIALATLVAAPAAAQPSLTPPGAAPPPPYAAPPPPAPDRTAWFAYNTRKKNGGVGVLLELFVPGLGSVYADHWTGAATTWGLFLGGFVLVGWGIGEAFEDESSDTAGLALTAGALMVVGGRVYGLVDSYNASQRYNRRLAASLGLRGLVLGPVPVRTSGQATVGLGASWQF